MTRLEAIKTDALSLTDAERAHLVADLLETLPGGLTETDDGVAEALKRDRELDENPDLAITFDQLKKSLGR